MKLTKEKLKQVIKEELENIMQEQLPSFTGPPAPPMDDPASPGDVKDPLDDFPGIRTLQVKFDDLRNTMASEWGGTPEGRQLAKQALFMPLKDLYRAMGELTTRIRQHQIEIPPGAQE
jgi:hypothetical protein